MENILSERQLAKIKSEQDERQRRLDARERELKRQASELERHNKLFEMKWRMLEDEVAEFAKDKEDFERKVRQEKRNGYSSYGRVGVEAGASMFFLGVHDELSLKKRYRDLLKLFHPDSMNGDLSAMQSINTEYERLKKNLGIS